MKIKQSKRTKDKMHTLTELEEAREDARVLGSIFNRKTEIKKESTRNDYGGFILENHAAGQGTINAIKAYAHLAYIAMNCEGLDQTVKQEIITQCHDALKEIRRQALSFVSVQEERDGSALLFSTANIGEALTNATAELHTVRHYQRQLPQ